MSTVFAVFGLFALLWLSVLTYIVLNHLHNHKAFREYYEEWKRLELEKLRQ